jgi:hypothetical protein
MKPESPFWNGIIKFMEVIVGEITTFPGTGQCYNEFEIAPSLMAG